MIAVALSGIVSLAALGSLLALIHMLVTQRWSQISQVMAEGAALSAQEAELQGAYWHFAA